MDQEWFSKIYNYNQWINEIKIELPYVFYELRNIGENDGFLCKLIREDAVEEFIIYVNRNNISRNATINPSIYETNSFLLKKKIQYNISLIEYTAFFGSIQIFTFLKNENVELKSSLWPFVIHSKNAELIHLLEDNHFELTIDQTLKESIKCHHNDVVNYFLDNYFQNIIDLIDIKLVKSLKFINFSFFTK